MKTKVLFVLFAAMIFAISVIGTQVLLTRRTTLLVPSAGAQEIIGGRVYAVTQDTFVITSNQSGTEVYVYFFDAKPEREKSTLEFITKAAAK